MRSGGLYLLPLRAGGRGRRPKVRGGQSARPGAGGARRRRRRPRPGPGAGSRAAAEGGLAVPAAQARALTPRPAGRPPGTFFSSFSLAPGGTPRMSYSFVSTTFAMAAGRAALGQEGGGADGAAAAAAAAAQAEETARGKRGRGYTLTRRTSRRGVTARGRPRALEAAAGRGGAGLVT